MNEYEKLLVLLTKNEIRFIVVGGFACVFNGHVRPTEDVDIIVDDHISISKNSFPFYPAIMTGMPANFQLKIFLMKKVPFVSLKFFQ